MAKLNYTNKLATCMAYKFVSGAPETNLLYNLLADTSREIYVAMPDDFPAFCAMGKVVVTTYNCPKR
jgi:hypothetical protein